MENHSGSWCESPTKMRRTEYKVQFADASEQCKVKTLLPCKPPEVPRSSSSNKLRNYNAASNSTSNLSACKSSSVGSKLNRNNTASSSTLKQDTFGSTTSLDRRRHDSSKSHSSERTLQPISNAKRTQSLDRRKLERSIYDSSGSLVLSAYERKRKERHDQHQSYDKRHKSKSPLSVGASDMNGYCNERSSKLSIRPKTSHPLLNSVEQSPYALSVSKSDALCDSNGTSSDQLDYLYYGKRSTSKSPHRKNSRLSWKEEEKENEKHKHRSSRFYDKKQDRERGQSLKRETPTGRLSADQWTNDNLWV